MEPGNYPDPVREAIGRGTSRVVQIASSVVTAAQVLVYLSRSYVNARRDNGPAAVLVRDAQQRAERAAAQASLAAIGEPGWLEDADLNRAIQAWGAVMPYADQSLPWHDPSAATAMRKAEERLRVLHPTAMARYDQLRSEGADPAGAMLQAVPLFGYPPGPRRTLPPQPWEQDFPLQIEHVLAATARNDAAASPPATPAVPAPAPRPRPQP